MKPKDGSTSLKITEKILKHFKLSSIIFTAFIFLITLFFFNLGLIETYQTQESYEKIEEYDLIVIFRNDDISGYNSDLKEFQEFFDRKNLPVTHGVIPNNVKNNENSCSKLKSFKEDFNRLEFAAHGYDHQGAEFDITRDQAIKKNKNIARFFDSCLESDPTTFIPPHNVYSEEARKTLADNYSVISAGEPQSHTDSTELNKKLNNDALEFGQSSSLVKNWESHPSEFYELDKLKRDFNESMAQGGVHVQVIHYRTFREGNINKLDELIKYMESQGEIKFLNFRELKHKVNNNKIKFVDGKWEIKEKN